MSFASAGKTLVTSIVHGLFCTSL